jgi:hypothetical protein
MVHAVQCACAWVRGNFFFHLTARMGFEVPGMDRMQQLYICISCMWGGPLVTVSSQDGNGCHLSAYPRIKNPLGTVLGTSLYPWIRIRIALDIRGYF